MTTESSFIIVGGGLAGAVAAQILREEGFDGRITLLGAEQHRPYERPPLSKDYLQGKADRDSVFVHPEQWYADHAVELRLGAAVTAIDPVSRTVTTAIGRRLGYDKLLLATGSTPRRLSLPGVDLDGVDYLRNIEDSDRIKAGFARRDESPSSALAGSAWRPPRLPASRDWTSPSSSPPRCPCCVSSARRLHPSSPPCTVTTASTCAARFRSQSWPAGMVRSPVRAERRQPIDADLVLVGVGITPNTQLAAEAGSTSATGSPSTSTSAPPIPTSSPPATSPTPTTRA